MILAIFVLDSGFFSGVINTAFSRDMMFANVFSAGMQSRDVQTGMQSSDSFHGKDRCSKET